MSVPWKYYSKYTKTLCEVKFAIIINSIIEELGHGIFLLVSIVNVSRQKCAANLKQVLLLLLLLARYLSRCMCLKICQFLMLEFKCILLHNFQILICKEQLNHFSYFFSLILLSLLWNKSNLKLSSSSNAIFAGILRIFSNLCKQLYWQALSCSWIS